MAAAKLIYKQNGQWNCPSFSWTLSPSSYLPRFSFVALCFSQLRRDLDRHQNQQGHHHSKTRSRRHYPFSVVPTPHPHTPCPRAAQPSRGSRR